MAKTGGLGDRLLVDGYNLSGDVGAVDNLRGGPAVQDFTHLSKSGVERIGTCYDASLDFTAFFNPSASQAHPVLSALPTTDRIATYLRGTTLAGPGAGLVAKQLNYDGKRGNDGSLTFSVSAQTNGYPLEWGVQGTAGVRTDTSATNGSSVDGVTATGSGLSAYLHVLSVAGTSVTVKVQSSSDNGVGDAWADLVSFTAVTPAGAPQGQRVQVSGDIERYLRVVTSGTFSSAVFACLLCRTANADPYTPTYESTY